VSGEIFNPIENRDCKNVNQSKLNITGSAAVGERRPFVTLSRCVCVRRISVDDEGNALYPVLSSYDYAYLILFYFLKLLLYPNNQDRGVKNKS